MSGPTRTVAASGKVTVIPLHHVAPERVSAEPVRERRGLVDVAQVLRERVVRNQEVAEDRRQDPEAEDRGAEDERLRVGQVAEELRPVLGRLPIGHRDGSLDWYFGDAHSTPR
jgi:hypothetical protein